MTNSTATTAIIRAHVEAVTKMLLGNAKMKPGVAITGGDTLDRKQQTRFAQMAAASATDLIHLEFREDPTGTYGLSGICVIVPRENGCYVYSGCKLWVGEGHDGARILPQPEVRGHFRLLSDELLHIDGKPSQSVECGVNLAQERIMHLMDARTSVTGQAAIHELQISA